MMGVINKQPTVDTTSMNVGWIPCSERLPSNLQEVAITLLNHAPESYYEEIRDVPQVGVAVYYNKAWYWYTPTTSDYLAEYQDYPPAQLDEALEVIAWQPLPKPYEVKHED